MDFLKAFENNWKVVLSVLVAFVIGGGVVTFLTNRSTTREKAAQENYFAIEKKLFELKSKKELPSKAANDKESVKVDKTSTKSDVKKDEAVDFTQVKKDFEKVMTDFPNSIAAQMSALHLAGLLVDEKNFEQALALLQKVENKDKGLVNTLLQQQIGQLLADKDKCPEAINVWQKIIERQEAAFIHSETKIQQALCYAKIKDLKKAEEILTNLANQSANPEVGNSPTSKEAEKYLRLLQFKKATGS